MRNEPIKLESTQINGANVLEVAVGTNGYKGGDAGHGSRTEFRLRDHGGTDIEIEVDQNRRGVTIRLAGDSELDTFTEALDFAVRTLRKQAGHSGDDRREHHGEYRIVIGRDKGEFAREVSAALSQGWSLYGDPILCEATDAGGAAPAQDSPGYLLGQALTRPSLAMR